MSIQTCVHEPSGEVIVIFTGYDGLPKPIRLNQIRGVWPNENDGMTVETVRRYGYTVTESIKELYKLLVKHNNTKAYYGPDWETSNEWPSWVTGE